MFTLIVSSFAIYGFLVGCSNQYEDPCYKLEENQTVLDKLACNYKPYYNWSVVDPTDIQSWVYAGVEGADALESGDRRF